MVLPRLMLTLLIPINKIEVGQSRGTNAGALVFIATGAMEIKPDLIKFRNLVD